MPLRYPKRGAAEKDAEVSLLGRAAPLCGRSRRTITTLFVCSNSLDSEGNWGSGCLEMGSVWDRIGCVVELSRETCG